MLRIKTMSMKFFLASLPFIFVVNTGDAKAESQFESVKKAAEAGDAHAQYSLGADFYIPGEGGADKDYAEAKKWLEKSASQGVTDAYYPLGVLYSFGFGVEKDHKKAVEYYKKAGAARSGSAYFNLAETYRQGLLDKKDDKQAIKYYKLASTAGNRKASEIAGWYYETGTAVRQNYTTALSYYRNAAEANLPSSQGAIGRFYDDGLGVKENNKKALEWYKKAADNGDISSMTNAGAMYKEGEGTERNYSMAKRYLEKGVENGSPESMYNLAGLYINGLGVDKDLIKGSELYKGACDKGFQQGCSTVKELRSKGMYHAGSVKPDSITMPQRLVAKSIESGVNATLIWEGDNAIFEANDHKIDCTFMPNEYSKKNQLATTFVCTENIQIILKNFQDTQNSYIAVMTDNFKKEVKTFSVNVYVSKG